MQSTRSQSPLHAISICNLHGNNKQKKHLLSPKWKISQTTRREGFPSVDFEILQNCFWDRGSLMEHVHAYEKLREPSAWK